MRRRDGSDETLVDSQQRVRIENDVIISMQIVRHDSGLTVNDLNETDDTGDYWCQVRLENGTVLQKKSNVLTLENEAQYRGLPPCSGSQSMIRVECIHPLQVTLPVATDATDVQTSDQVTRDATEEPPESRADFYAIVAVVVVFCILTVALSIIIVMLCKKKHGQARFQTRSGKQLLLQTPT